MGLVSRALGLQRDYRGRPRTGASPPLPLRPGTSHKGSSGPQFQNRTSNGFKPELPRQPSASLRRLPWSRRWQPPREELRALGRPPCPHCPMGPLASPVSDRCHREAQGAGSPGPCPWRAVRCPQGRGRGPWPEQVHSRPLVDLPILAGVQDGAAEPWLALPDQTWNFGRGVLGNRNPRLEGRGQSTLAWCVEASPPPPVLPVAEPRGERPGQLLGLFVGRPAVLGLSHSCPTEQVGPTHHVRGLLPGRASGQVLSLRSTSQFLLPVGHIALVLLQGQGAGVSVWCCGGRLGDGLSCQATHGRKRKPGADGCAARPSSLRQGL